MPPRKKKKSAADTDFILMLQFFLSATFLLVLGAWLLTPQYKSWFVQQVKNSAVSTNIAAIAKAMITFDFGSRKRAFEGPIIQNQTIADALRQAAKAGRINLTWKEVNRIPRLVGVDNYINGQKSWAVYLNGKKLTSTLYETIIKPNDEILLVYRQ